MNWQKLFSEKRFGFAISKSNKMDRGTFQKDHDRLIFSPQFRNLQNKTQVFPLPGAVYVHNRLTHSLEVAAVGRSLGQIVGEKIAAKNDFDLQANYFYQHDLAEVIRVACLAHDIGNPPFGHAGENAIKYYFNENSSLLKDLSENQRADFLNFEGNANAFRILGPIFKGEGLKMNITTLASIVKYPTGSLYGFNKESGLINTKKSGYFSSEEELFKVIAQALEIPKLNENTYARHPFVYLVEAADDICYRIIDLEDSHNLGIISYKEIEELLLPFFIGNPSEEYITNKLPTLKKDSQKLALLRAFLINILVEKVAENFLESEEELLNGTLNSSIIDNLEPKLSKLLANIDTFSYERIYQHKNVLNIEILGFKVINGLLEELTKAVLQPDNHYSKKMLMLTGLEHKDLSTYQKLQGVVDYVSGMTDLFAVDLYKKIKGIEIPFI